MLEEPLEWPLQLRLKNNGDCVREGGLARALSVDASMRASVDEDDAPTAPEDVPWREPPCLDGPKMCPGTPWEARGTEPTMPEVPREWLLQLRLKNNGDCVREGGLARALSVDASMRASVDEDDAPTAPEDVPWREPPCLDGPKMCPGTPWEACGTEPTMPEVPREWLLQLRLKNNGDCVREGGLARALSVDASMRASVDEDDAPTAPEDV
ncbi:uncharacterized protein LOC121170713 [Ochotona curzoniae]|uniref:uncharacterized protein LOC121170713 n=1 Tax=Ochotona curzoniae TaxID=130825 RepID=UPI001B353329|nr:uncharacterized protein LOC121170713 [Ochotona curzoniae]